MEENRIAKFFEKEAEDLGTNWYPKTHEETEEFCINCSKLMASCLRDHGLFPMFYAIKIKNMVMTMMRLSLFISRTQDIKFLEVMSINLSAVSTLIVTKQIEIK